MPDSRRLRTYFYEFSPIHLCTAEGKWLRIDAGEEQAQIFCTYALRIHEKDESGDVGAADIIALDLFLMDESGHEWRAQKLIHPHSLTSCLAGPVRFFHEPVGDSYTHFTTDAERAKAFADALHLEGVLGMSDGWQSTVIGPKPHWISHNFQGNVRYDFAGKRMPRSLGRNLTPRSEDDFLVDTLSVRLSGCFPYCLDEEGADTQFEHYVDGEFRENMAPIQFEVGLHQLLRMGDPYYMEEDEYWETTQIPLPLVFRRTGETGEPQPGVTVVEAYGA
jgi:hypothetical protein